MAKQLDGRRVLVVEDEYLAAIDMKQMIEERGGVVIGPAGCLDEGLALAQSESLDGAILDVNLDGRNSFPLADALLARGTAVVLATGYDAPMLPARFAGTPRLTKPLTGTSFEKALRQAFGTS